MDGNPIDLPAPIEDVSFDVFRQDLKTGTLRRVGVDAAGNLPPPVRTPDAADPAKRCDPGSDPQCPQLANSFSPAISANGRLVAFATDSVFLPEDRNDGGDVYVKDLVTRRLTLVSVANAGRPPRPAVGGVPVPLSGMGHVVAISDNGRFVAFMTNAMLNPRREHNNALDVYVRDLRMNRFFLASIDAQGRAGGVGSLDFPVDPAIDISANGRFVVFTSLAALNPTDGNGQADVYVWDRLHHSAAPILASGGAEPPPGFFDPFGVPRGLLSSSPALSADGRFVVFQSSAALSSEDRNDVSDIYRYDRVDPSFLRVSLDAEARGTAVEGSRDPAISARGRFVAFSSAAGDLVLHDTSFGFTDRSFFDDASRFPEDIFVKDLRTGATTRASLDDDGIESDGTSFSPSLSADASLIAFITDDPGILDPLSGNDRPGDSVVVTGVDFAAFPDDDVSGAPPGAVSIRRNFGADPSGSFFRQPDPQISLHFALRNRIDQPGDQDWFRVSLFGEKTYVIDLEGRPTGQGTLNDPVLRIFQAKVPGEDPEVGPSDDDGGEGRNAKLVFQPPEEGTYFISAESFGAATGTYRLLVREQ